MMLAMDPWLSDLLERLKLGLPIAIATTIVMSLLIKFWKKLIQLAKRALGLEEPPKEKISHSFPEGEIANCYTLGNFRQGFSVGIGWSGAVVDKGIVQRELGSGRYRRRAVRKLIAGLSLSETARVILWRNSEFPVVVSLNDLFSADHQPMQLKTECVFKLKSADLLHAYLEEITLPLDHIAKHVSETVALPMRRWVGTLQGEDPYQHRERLPEWSETVKGLIQSALRESPFEIARVTDLRLFSPALDQLYNRFGELAKENASAREEVERNRLRGSLRQAILAGKLEEMRDQSQFEDAVRVVAQEKALKERAMRQELERSELQDVEEKLQGWKRKQALLLQMLDAREGGPRSAAEAARNVTDDLRRLAVESADSPFSAQEKQQICALLQGLRNQALRPEEIISAVAKGADIPSALLDPLARIRGPHTLHVGEGWRIFDGDSLFQVRLTRIDTRRHGFLWHLESPSQAHFEMRVSPDNRRFEQDVVLPGSFHLDMGPHRIPLEYLGGTPSRISLRIPEVRSAEV